MKNKKGFTLIELLAVIVILAVIALIATPIILNMIDNAKKGAAKASTYGYIDAIEKNNALADFNIKYTKIPDQIDIDVTTIDVKIKGKKPISGTITIEKGIVKEAKDICINGYIVNYKNNEVTVGKNCDENNIQINYLNLSGVLTDSSNNPLQNKVIVVFSDTPHYALTTSSGYFYVEKLEEGKHELYYLDKKISEVQSMNKEEIKNNAISSSIFKTTDDEIVLENVNISDVIINKENKFKIGKFWNFDYTGEEAEFLTPVTGKYKVELWGAEGGQDTWNQGSGGKGAYTAGNIEFKYNNKIYVYVGQKGNQNIGITGGVASFNGGGAGGSAFSSYIGGASGGGATDIRLVNGIWNNQSSLNSRIMVAAGGGGSGFGRKGGYAGGLNGGTGFRYIGNDTEIAAATGATQTSGYMFGIGQKPSDHKTLYKWGAEGNGGGGGGYYGGTAWNTIGASQSGSGAGGSSFISGHVGCDAIAENSTEDNIIHTGQPNHYSNYVFTNTNMLAGNETMPTHDGTSTMIGNNGNGYAKITLVSFE